MPTFGFVTNPRVKTGTLPLFAYSSQIDPFLFCYFIAFHVMCNANMHSCALRTSGANT